MVALQEAAVFDDKTNAWEISRQTQSIRSGQSWRKCRETLLLGAERS